MVSLSSASHNPRTSIYPRTSYDSEKTLEPFYLIWAHVQYKLLDQRFTPTTKSRLLLR